MATLFDAVLKARDSIEGLRLRDARREELAAEAKFIKERYLRSREVFESLAGYDGAGTTEIIEAAAAFIDITANRLAPLAEHPATQASPLARDVNETLEKLRSGIRGVAALTPAAVASRDAGKLAGEAIKLLDIYDALIVRQLALIHRESVDDYYGGLDRESPYPSYRCTASNRGRIKSFSKETQSAFWNTKIGGLIWTSAIVDRNGDLYTGHADGEFTALKPDGTVKWRIHDEFMMYIDSTGALGCDGFLYMASTDCDPRGHQNQGRIWKIDPEDGRILWTFRGLRFEDPETNPDAHLSSFFEGNVSLGEENGEVFIYAGSDDNRLYKLNSDGALVWEYFTGTYPSGVIWTKPLISPDGNTVFIGELSGMVHAVSAASGRAVWRRQLGGSVVSSPAMGMFGELFLGCFDGKVYALAPEDGTVFWSYQTLGLIYSSAAIAENGDVVICSSDCAIYRLDRYGKKLWTYYTDAPVKSSPLIDPDGLIYVGNQNGKVYCLRPDGRRLWSYATNPGVVENDINASASMGADGTLYMGTTTGEVFAIPRDYYYKNRADEKLAFEPGHDGSKPDIPPGGAALVFIDDKGAPCFSPPRALEISSNLNLAFFAVDENSDIIPAEISQGGVIVEISPELPLHARVESMGRCVYIIPDGNMEYDTRYAIRCAGKYVSAGVEHDFDSTIEVGTAPRREGAGFPLTISDEAASAMVVHSAVICRPKELDALGQAMTDSLNFALSPIYIDKERNIVAAAVCAVSGTGSNFEFAPANVNKMIAAGTFRDEHLKLDGKMRLVAQGANALFERFRVSGRVSPGPRFESGMAWCVSPCSAMPKLADITRIMRLSDSHDDVCGLVSFSSSPFDSPAARRPAGLEISASLDGDRISASITAPGWKAADHWAHVAIINTETGSVVEGNKTVVATDAAGVVTGVESDVPRGAEGGNCVAVVVMDLFPAAVVRIGAGAEDSD